MPLFLKKNISLFFDYFVICTISLIKKYFQSPYSYSFNNPVSWRDPSGLAPEREKGDRVLERVWNTSVLLQQWGYIEQMMEAEFWEWREASRAMFEDTFNYLDEWLKRIGYFNKKGVGDGGGSGESSDCGGRTGEESDNGITGAWEVKNEWNKDYEQGYRDYVQKERKKCTKKVMSILVKTLL
jgi:hypothetical protein